MAGERPLALREPDDPERPDYQSFIEMHKQFAALDIWRKEKEEGKEISRPPPKLISPIQLEKPVSKAPYNSYDEEKKHPHVAECLKRANEAASSTILGFKESNIHLPYYKLIVGDQIIKGIEDSEKDKEKGKFIPCLADMPKEVIVEIFRHLYPQWQVCFALSSKRFMKISKEVNDGWGVVYPRAAKFHILWRLKAWMTDSRKLCMSCEQYYPISPQFWINRQQNGPCATASTIYGRTYTDFQFVEGNCPECLAEEKWRRICSYSAALQGSSSD